MMNNSIITSMITASRNISGYKFSTTISKKEKSLLQKLIFQAAEQASLTIVPITMIELSEQLELVSQGIITKSFMLDPENFLLHNKANKAYFVVCDDNHLTYKLQCKGFFIDELYEQCMQDLDKISKYLKFAWSPEFGFITTLIHELGTGMVFSFLIHLPALSLYGVLDSVFRQILETGCEITSRSLSSFGANGAFFTITMPALPLGFETFYVNKIKTALQSLMDYEKTIQAKLIQENKLQLYDKIGRAFGLLKYAYEISYDEYISIMSDIRFGIQTGIIACKDLDIIDSYVLSDPVLAVNNASEKLDSEAQNRALAMKKLAKYITFNDEEIKCV